MHCTIPEIAMLAPAPLRSFRAFRTLKRAVSFIERHDEAAQCKLVKRSYGDARDVRYVVNYVGSSPRQRVSLAKARLIMWHGMTVNRQLPALRA